MKRIRRLDEPTPGLSDYRARGVPTWRGFRRYRAGAAYRELRSALTVTQRGLCGYCEIPLAEAGAEIEHVLPRSAGPLGTANTLVVANLMASCPGGTDRSAPPDAYLAPIPENQSCGAAKGRQTDPAFLDPRRLPLMPSLFHVVYDGRIAPNESACAAVGIPVSRVAVTIRMLGLDVERLRKARARQWVRLLSTWESVADDPVALTRAAREALMPDADGVLDGFFTTARSYFHKVAEPVLAEAPEEWV